jgi:hypothetical protein
MTGVLSGSIELLRDEGAVKNDDDDVNPAEKNAMVREEKCVNKRCRMMR